MEEIIPLIFHGCKLARELESNLPNLANQPNILWQSCDQIIRIFSNATDRMNAQLLISRGGDQVENVGGAMLLQQQQQWLRCSPGHSADLVFHPQLLEQQQDQAGLLEGMVVPNLSGAGEMERWRSSGGAEVVQSVDVPDTGRGSSSSQRSRRRKNDGDNLTVRVAAPRMGNTEVPPEDGYTWRKYGQKEILGSRFPRAYFRCTHQKLYHCPAKKQVQRLDHDPFIFEVTYRGHHKCTMSSTAPSISVPLATPVLITQQATPTPVPSSQLQAASDSVSLGRHWLSMDIRPPNGESAGTSASAFVDMQRYRNFSLSGSSSDVVGSGGAGAGPSTLQFGRDPDQNYQPVAEFADVIFNSASSTNSNMDLIFSAAMDDKWDAGTGDHKQN